ncbi:UDP-4-amino-4,6-dideoxy-N-acetyl-beta-L-altrosamine transaminase [Dendrosporobacter sp. 1207_IL3150]|uniref:UDP-4-amino-4, 6-dideoxy-N-acetyl-beta-L-altrosamine transaminase n=1 Tax=Dendrosporobacter sp. 1207_IL3150 TaxID=3084054 RepID=UPI002FDA202F
MKQIPYGRQNINKEDIDSVVKILKSDWLTQGPMIERFEKAVAEYAGAKYAVAVNSATAALHLACLAAGLEPQDRLWTSPNSFVASANCGLYCGAEVDFVDIDARTYNMSVEMLSRKLESAAKTHTLPKVVVPVHFSGQSCDMAAIANLAKKYQFTIVEDASHAIGGSYLDSKIGCCQYSDMTVFSFHPVKIVTTGEGGMVLTNNKDLYDKLVLLRSHGITRNTELMTEKSHGLWYYQQIELGYNYRITDIQAALGHSQLSRIDSFIARRREIADRYNALLKDLPVITPWQDGYADSAWHLYVIRIKLDEISASHSRVFEFLREAGIGVNLHYIPIHMQPYYSKLGFKKGMFTEAEKYYQEAISLPIYFDLQDEEQDYIVAKIREVLG